MHFSAFLFGAAASLAIANAMPSGGRGMDEKMRDTRVLLAMSNHQRNHGQVDAAKRLSIAAGGTLNRPADQLRDPSPPAKSRPSKKSGGRR